MDKFFGYDFINNKMVLKTPASGLNPDNVRFVSPSFNDTAPYFTTITGAINDLNQGLVIVYPGVYTETVNMKDNIYVYGFPGAILELGQGVNGFIFESTVNSGLFGYFNINYSSFQYGNNGININTFAQDIFIEFDSCKNGVFSTLLTYGDSLDNRIKLRTKFNEVGAFTIASMDSRAFIPEFIDLKADKINQFQIQEIDLNTSSHLKFDYNYGEMFQLWQIFNDSNGVCEFHNIKIKNGTNSIDSCGQLRFYNCFFESQYYMDINNSNYLHFRDCAFKGNTGIYYTTTGNTNLFLHSCLIQASNFAIENTSTTYFLYCFLTACAFSVDVRPSFLTIVTNDYIVGGVEAF